MPNLRVKDPRPPELHLPEMTRKDLAHLMSEGGAGLRAALSNLELPRVDLSSVELGDVVERAAAAIQPGRRSRRPRWPLIVGGLIVAGLASRAVLGNEAVRARLAQVFDAVRSRIQALRSPEDDRHEQEDAIAFPAAMTAPIEASPFTDASPTEAPDDPPGLGSNDEERTTDRRDPAGPGDT